MMNYTLYREDPDTGEEIAIELEVEIDSFYPGSIPGPCAISDDPGELELGAIFRADTGERFEPTKEELDRITEELWERLCRPDPEEYWAD